MFGVGNDWDAAAARTPGTGQSVVFQYLATIGDTYWVQKQDNPTTTGGTTSTISDSAPTNHRYNLAICEVLPAGGSTPTWSVSGSVTPAASGSGTTLTLGGRTTVADASGNYSFSGLANGSYTIAPSKNGFTFTPTNQVVNVNGANVTGANFTAQPVSSSGIQLVQKNVNGSEASGSNISATFSSSNTQGDFLIVTGTSARRASTISISDSAGNTHIPAIGPVNDPAQDVNAYIWYVPNCKAGPNTITLTPSSTSALELHITEWSGVAASSPIDQVASGVGSGTIVTTDVRTTSVGGGAHLRIGLGDQHGDCG